ncbi:DMT family transporter [Alicyclobacillus dauci]|uniref:DMT family transporter n=1 Tax=Alicyclobacillus dauci TaxID=1475485 RepID=A0ABY6Z082_9BACL|nr:DMT family transporter [Alicyclobacillus dauci]WAH35928.1 DMT family transporter [Alicyclobacillus dauci]
MWGLLGQMTAMLCAVCYALSYIFIRKGQTESSPPDNGLFPILVISSVTLDGASVLMGILDPSTIDVTSKDILLPCVYAALSGLIGTLLGRLTLYTAIKDLGATRGVVVKGLSPIITLAIVVIGLDQRIVRDDWIGLGCLLTAVGLLFCERQFTNQRTMAFALFRNSIFIAILSAFAQGTGHAFRQLSVSDHMEPTYAAAIDVTTALIGYLLVLVLRGRPLTLLNWYRRYTNSSLILAGVWSSLAVLLFFTAVRQIPVSTVSVLVATEPILVALFSVLFFPRLERLTWWSACASIVVAGGVVFISL